MRRLLTENCRTIRRIGAGLALAIALLPGGLTVPGALKAQTAWQDPFRPSGLRLELYGPGLVSAGSDGRSVVGFARGRIRTSPRWLLVADLPVALTDGNGFGNPNVVFGAPYLGFEIRRPGWVVEGGLQVPVTSASGEVFGHAFDSREAIPVTLAGRWGGTSAGGLVHGIRLGPRLLVPTRTGDVEISLDAAALVGFEGARFGVEAEIDGRGFLGLQAYRRMGSDGRLGVLIRLPLEDEPPEVHDFHVGIVASFEL